MEFTSSSSRIVVSSRRGAKNFGRGRSCRPKSNHTSPTSSEQPHSNPHSFIVLYLLSHCYLPFAVTPPKVLLLYCFILMVTGPAPASLTSSTITPPIIHQPAFPRPLLPSFRCSASSSQAHRTNLVSLPYPQSNPH
jgi:hypothetical protein